MNNNLLVILIVLVAAGVIGYMVMNNNEEAPATGTDDVTMEETTNSDEQLDDTGDAMPNAAGTQEEGTGDTSTGRMETIMLTPVEGSMDTQTGTAVLEEVEGNLMVTLTLTGYTTTEAQPAHIHAGSCPTPGDVVYPLENVMNGTSTTTLADVTIDQLIGQMPLAVNVHKSTAEIDVYTACGNIEIE